MKKNWRAKRILSLLLALMLIVSGVAIPASADSSSAVSYDQVCDQIVSGETIEDISDIPNIPYADLLEATGKTVTKEYPYVPSDEQLEIEGQKDATVVEYADGSEEIIYRIPIYDQGNTESRSFPVSYVDVGIEGNGNGTITAKLWRAGNIGPCNLKMQILYGTCRTETPTNVHNTKSNITSVGPLLSPTTLSSNISTTKYFIVRVTGTFMENNIDHKTYSILFNKKAVRYPEYTCPVSGIYCVSPFYSNFTRVPSIAWNGRAAYIKWFNNTYNNGNAPWNWNDYEIHHIRQRNFGGTNDYDNLIPLPKATHVKYSTWWLNYA